MPLGRGYGRKTVSRNIAEMVRAGKPKKQAVAASVNSARKAKSGRPVRGSRRGALAKMLTKIGRSNGS